MTDQSSNKQWEVLNLEGDFQTYATGLTKAEAEDEIQEQGYALGQVCILPTDDEIRKTCSIYEIIERLVNVYIDLTDKIATAQQHGSEKAQELARLTSTPIRSSEKMAEIAILKKRAALESWVDWNRIDRWKNAKADCARQLYKEIDAAEIGAATFQIRLTDGSEETVRYDGENWIINGGVITVQ